MWSLLCLQISSFFIFVDIFEMFLDCLLVRKNFIDFSIGVLRAGINREDLGKEAEQVEGEEVYQTDNGDLQVMNE